MAASRTVSASPQPLSSEPSAGGPVFCVGARIRRGGQRVLAGKPVNRQATGRGVEEVPGLTVMLTRDALRTGNT